MKRMHPLIEDCVKNLERVLEIEANNKNEIDLKKVMGNLTMDAIATCAFATKIDTHNDLNNPFVKNAEKAFSGSLKTFLTLLILFTFPSLGKKFQLRIFEKSVTEFFSNAVSLQYSHKLILN
jgi:cytochrome P450